MPTAWVRPADCSSKNAAEESTALPSSCSLSAISARERVALVHPLMRLRLDAGAAGPPSCVQLRIRNWRDPGRKQSEFTGRLQAPIRSPSDAGLRTPSSPIGQTSWTDGTPRGAEYKADAAQRAANRDTEAAKRDADMSQRHRTELKWIFGLWLTSTFALGTFFGWPFKKFQIMSGILFRWQI